MSAFRIVEHQVPCQHIREYPGATANNQNDVLHLAVKQYIPRDNPNPRPGDVTIIGAHANAFPKELYEPLWDEILSRSKKQGWRIRSIWIADVAQQGASSVLNEDVLGNDPSWLDHSRDLLHLINIKRDQMPRPLVGIGHSMGGGQLVNLAYIHPRLFTTLVLLDPVVQPKSAEVEKKASAENPGVAQLSTFRRTTWPSRAEAAALFAKSPFYQKWDRRVFDLWVKHGLREGPTVIHPELSAPAVTLTTAAAHEVHTFLRPNYEGYGVDGKPTNRETHADIMPGLPDIQPFYRAEPVTLFNRLPELRPSVLYIFGGTSDVSPESFNKLKLERTGAGTGGSGGVKEGRVEGVTLEGIGHLVAMEATARTADAASEWISKEMSRWHDSEKRFEEKWKAKTLKERQEIDDEWKRHMPRRKKSSKI